MAAYVYVTCPGCGWKSQTWHGGPSGKMMGICTAGRNAEDEFESHFRNTHMEAKYHDSNCAYCGKPIEGDSGVWHTADGVEHCSLSPTDFHESQETAI